MSSLLIQNVLLPSDDRRRADVLIEGSRISKIGSVSPADHPEADLIEGDGLAIIPGFVNGHTHSAQRTISSLWDDCELTEGMRMSENRSSRKASLCSSINFLISGFVAIVVYVVLGSGDRSRAEGVSIIYV